jgi:hypothetical protein
MAGVGLCNPTGVPAMSNKAVVIESLRTLQENTKEMVEFQNELFLQMEKHGMLSKENLTKVFIESEEAHLKSHNLLDKIIKSLEEAKHLT